MSSPVNTRIINIALVGHVANGKTTLVNALTGVNTKRSSTEKATGRTIKLGYANCIIWSCEKCKQVYSCGQADKHPECCLGEMKKEAVVSFVDAPGHHSYVHTMVKGATVVDGAMLVTDVRKEPMQTQTTEHLAILSILGVSNIIVVQNKADLVGPERCREHYAGLKQELKGTTAEDSPIIPVSAQNNINIDVLREVLLKMVTGILSGYTNMPTKKKQGAFQIIRSFDINRPGDEVEKLKGGILGGTVVGDANYSIGDVVEIRPGLVRKDKTYTILTTEVLSIFAETQACKTTTIGGLYGIGTKLDPCLTIADGLSGNLLGKSGELPDVIDTIEMSITKVSLDDSHTSRVKPKSIYRLIIGNIVVDAEAQESKKPKSIIMKLTRPICTMETRCLVYNVESSNTKLVAFGSFAGDAESNNRESKQEEKKKLELTQANLTQHNYEDLIKDLVTHEKAIVKIPTVKTARENRNIIWYNIEDFSKAIYRTVDEISKHLAAETMLNISKCANGLRIYKTNINPAKVESIMRKYIKEFVVCKQCSSLNTTADKCLNCSACVRDVKVT